MPDLPAFFDQTLLLLASAAFLAGFIDSIAGGGGLITIPALILSGMSPVEALGTNKLQGLFGAASATWSYAGKGQVNPRSQWKMALAAFAAAACGALIAAHISPDWFKTFLPFLLVAIALYFALKPDASELDGEQRISPAIFASSAVPLIGFYDGIFGPGTGSFFMLAFVALAGYGILKATAHTKLLNFSSNLGGFVIFAAFGVISWKTGLIMGAAQWVGARIGSSLAVKNGAKLIRPLLVITCVALAARLFWTA